MMGDSNYQTRSELLFQMATGITKDVDAATQARFDNGHSTEALAREIAGDELGEGLAPISGATDDGYLTANYDGLTFDGRIGWEHKAWNEKLAAAVRAKELPPSHYWQLEQQILVGQLDYVMFDVSDGTRENRVSMDYFAVPGRAQQLLAGWKQFDVDLSNYKPRITKEMPKAEVKIQLPALFVNAQGAITDSNMEEFGVALASKMIEIRAIKLVTDLDFSNAKEAAKMLREQREKMVLTKAAMLEQTMTIGQAARLMDTWAEDMRVTALQLEKEVEKEDLAKKRAMVLEGNEAFSKIHVSLATEIKGILLEVDKPDFAAAIKSKRSYTSMQDAIDTALALATSAATVKMVDIRAKLIWCKETSTGYGFLFSDLQQIVGKQMDEFQLLVTSRITEHKHNESVKLEAETTRIRLEEEAKAKLESDKVIADGIAAGIQKQADDRAAELLEQRRKEAQIKDQVELSAGITVHKTTGTGYSGYGHAGAAKPDGGPVLIGMDMGAPDGDKTVYPGTEPITALEPIKTPYTASDTREINVVISVPLDWEERLDMLDYILEEVASDHWTWNFVEQS